MEELFPFIGPCVYRMGMHTVLYTHEWEDLFPLMEIGIPKVAFP